MKFKAELGYCQKARIKTGLGAVKEIVGIYCDHSITLSESGIITLYINQLLPTFENIKINLLIIRELGISGVELVDI